MCPFMIFQDSIITCIVPLTGDSQTRPNPFYFSLGGSQAHIQLHTTAAQHSIPYPHLHSSSFSPNISSGRQAGARTATAVTLNQNLNIDEKMLAKMLLDKGRKGKKRRGSNDTSGSGGGSATGFGFGSAGGVASGGRIASWAGPVSIRRRADNDEDEDEEEGSEVSEVGKVDLSSMGMAKSKNISASATLVPPKDWGKLEKDKERTRFDNLVRVVDREGRLVEEEMDSEDDDDESGEESGSEYGRGRGESEKEW
jgi:hypothetical protein